MKISIIAEATVFITRIQFQSEKLNYCQPSTFLVGQIEGIRNVQEFKYHVLFIFSISKHVFAKNEFWTPWTINKNERDFAPWSQVYNQINNNSIYHQFNLLAILFISKFIYYLSISFIIYQFHLLCTNFIYYQSHLLAISFYQFHFYQLIYV